MTDVAAKPAPGAPPPKGNSRSGRPLKEASPHAKIMRADWAKLRADTPLILSDKEIDALSGVTEQVSAAEVEDIYLPLSRLLNLHVQASQNLHSARQDFLGNVDGRIPFIIGVAGSVAVGKSTSARILKALLARWPEHRRVALLGTDGFLLPNRVLEERNLMQRKGFPESYDTHSLLLFLADIKAGKPKLKAPVYSHLSYDVVPDKFVTVDRPDILVVEGLNVLQPARLPKDGEAVPFVSDFFDFSIYIDAAPEVIESWYVERFLRLRHTAFKDPSAYFHRYAALDDEAARERSLAIWRSINLLNLQDNILPTRQRADLILRKGADHRVERVLLRKV
jgi:type I pantothenate kinase